jgi:hypothetical protein
MRNKWIKRLFPFLFVFLLPWPIAHATDVNEPTDGETVMVEVAEPSARPSYTTFGRAIGGVSNPGDLFYIDATGSASEIKVTLYLTNTQQLVRHYQYLILNTSIYVENGEGEWERATASDGKLIPKTIISMQNGRGSFLLPGDARYRIAIDGGCFYCHRASADSGSMSPQFSLEVI